jgi:hypothetical protein
VLERLEDRPFVLLASFTIHDVMFVVQVSPKVSITRVRAIGRCLFFTKALQPVQVVLSNHTNDKGRVTYKQALHRLIVSPSSLTNSVKKNAISVSVFGSSELVSTVSVQSVLD